MTTTLDLGPAPATPQPRCEAAAWCIGHAIPGDTVHLSAETTVHGLPIYLKRIGDGPTFANRAPAGRTLEWTPAQAMEVGVALLALDAAAQSDNRARGISADTGSEASR